VNNIIKERDAALEIVDATIIQDRQMAEGLDSLRSVLFN